MVRAFAHGGSGSIELFVVPSSAPRLVQQRLWYVSCCSLLLIRKSSPCGSSGFPLSLFEWSVHYQGEFTPPPAHGLVGTRVLHESDSIDCV